MTEKHIHYPKWMREVSSIAEFSEAFKDSQVKAAFLRLPSTYRAAFERCIHSNLLFYLPVRAYVEENIFDRAKECIGTLRRKTLEEKENAEAQLNAVCAMENHASEMQRAFPENGLSYTIMAGQPSDYVRNWHRDPSDTCSLRIVRTFYGPSTEYAEDKEGTCSVKLPDECVTAHRYKAHETGGTFHRAPECRGNLRIVFGIDVCKAHNYHN